MITQNIESKGLRQICNLKKSQDGFFLITELVLKVRKSIFFKFGRAIKLMIKNNRRSETNAFGMACTFLDVYMFQTQLTFCLYSYV